MGTISVLPDQAGIGEAECPGLLRAPGNGADVSITTHEGEPAVLDGAQRGGSVLLHASGGIDPGKSKAFKTALSGPPWGRLPPSQQKDRV